MLRRLLSLLLCLAAALVVFWPQPAWAAAEGTAGGAVSGAVNGAVNGAVSGAALFENHCVGCHLHGGNIIRRGKTLQLATLRRNGIEGPEAIAAIAAGGIGQMGGYARVLGEGGPEAVGLWVWQQAEAGWPKG